MFLFRRLPLMSALALALVAVALPVSAQDRGERGDRDERGNSQSQDPQRSRNDALSDAVRRIERANRGQVLSAERMQYDGREVNRIKVLDDDGRIRIYMDEPPARQDRPPRGDRPERQRDN